MQKVIEITFSPIHQFDSYIAPVIITLLIAQSLYYFIKFKQNSSEIAIAVFMLPTSTGLEEDVGVKQV